ncbi:hypothetical protein [Longimicrobium terrae]|nr:hypothetical protein [Longimicrobium terrae]MBB4637513.1 hypothetical protein [Longimicrobium terrae]NNC30457.1 hypothetical protein [Longimicrobium terrae]
MRRLGHIPGDAEVEAAATRLFARIDPTAPSNVVDLETRALPHVYPDAVLRPLDRRLAATVTNRGRLYLQGERLGVGASTLAGDYSRAFNHRAGMHRDPRRIAYMPILSGSRNPVKLLDALCEIIRAPLSVTELRFRSVETLARRFVEGIRAHRVCTIIFDHIHHCSRDVLQMIGELMLVSDPSYRVPLELDEYDSMVPRLGFVLVTHNPPETLLGPVPELLHLLEGEHAVLRPYASAAVTAEAIRQSGIGLQDLDLTTLDDALMAQVAHEVTQGLIDQLLPFLRLIDAITRYGGLRRPTLEAFKTALPFHRHLRQKITKQTEPAFDGRAIDSVLERAGALRDLHLEPLRAAGGAGQGRADTTAKITSGRGHPALRAIREGRAAAEDERKAAVARPRKRKAGP